MPGEGLDGHGKCVEETRRGLMETGMGLESPEAGRARGIRKARKGDWSSRRGV